MSLIRKSFLLLIFFITIFLFTPKVTADVILPSCQWNEVMEICFDNCSLYENNPKYTQLLGNSYCRKAFILELINKYIYILIPLFITTVIELLVFIKRDYKSKKNIGFVVLANFISLPLGFLIFDSIKMLSRRIIDPIFPLQFYRPYGQIIIDGLAPFLLIEVMIIMFEWLFLAYVAKLEDRKKVFFTVLIANGITLFLGIIVLGSLLFITSSFKPLIP